MSKQLATGAGITVGATLLMGGAAQAATLTVGSTDDTTGATDCAVATNTDCTLRDAIEDANATPASTIVFASAISGETITLNGTELPQITAYDTTIQGPSGGITVDGDATSRIFNVSATDARISGLAVRNGLGDYGGGIFVQAGQLTLSEASVSDNTSTGGGGGVAVHTGTLTLESSTISGNTAGAFGGGIYGEAHSGSGGAGTIAVRNSTISGNTAADYGGGVYFNYRTADSVVNSTIYDNSAGADGGGLYHFGGVLAGEGLVVTGTTITHNDADRGGGIASAGESDQAYQPVIRDSIVSANAAAAGADVSAVTGTLEVDFSLIGAPDPATILDRTGPNLTGQDPQLGPLADNGGPTETQKPAATSPVVDAGSAFALTSDQRGLARPFDAITANAAGGDASDIGAVELQVSDTAAAPGPPTTTPPTTTSPGVTKKKCKKHKKKHKRSAESAKKKKGCKKKKKKR
jgi:hypothetical protein